MLRAEVLGTVNGIRIKTHDAYALSDEKVDSKDTIQLLTSR